ATSAHSSGNPGSVLAVVAMFSTSTPLTALLAAGAVVVVLWVAVATVRDYAGAVTNAGPPAPAPTAAPAQEAERPDTAAAASDEGGAVEAEDASPQPMDEATVSAPPTPPDTAGAPNGDTQAEDSGPADTAAPEAAAPSATAGAPEGGGQGTGAQDSESGESGGGSGAEPGEGSGGSGSGESGSEDDAGSGSGGPGSGFLDGLIDFFNGGTSEAG
ncbi:hypothetical protein ACFQZ2_15325, partial [Streptomonospora algeriensis]